MYIKNVSCVFIDGECGVLLGSHTVMYRNDNDIAPEVIHIISSHGFNHFLTKTQTMHLVNNIYLRN